MKYKIYRKDSGWRLQYTDIEGKRRRKNFKTKRDASVYVEDLKSITVDVVITHKTIREHYSDEFKSSQFISYFLDKFGDLKAHELSSTELNEWLIKYQTDRNLKRKTMYEYRYTINPFFKYLISIKAINKNPMDKCKFKKIDSSKYTPEYMEALFYYSPYLLWRLIWLEKETGLSRKAICNLKWSDDLDRFESHVKMFINLLPRRCEYVLGNYKAKKIDCNLVSRRMREFEKNISL